jgi:ABC-type transport system substrate-binding protein
LKTVLITGGSRGIGASCVKLFSEAGYSVAFTYKNSEAAAQALAKKYGALAILADNQSEADITAAVERTVLEYGRIDCLINNASVSSFSLLQDVSRDTWDKTLGTNLKLRQVLNAAFDYPAWEKFYNGRITEANGPVPPGVEGRLETPAPYAYDLEKARRLMVEAGYPGGRDRKTGRRLTLTLSIGRASQESREAGELMAAFYGKIGINLELHFMTWTAFVDAVSQGRVQLFRMGWVGDYPDAQNFLQLFYSANLSPGSNHSAYVNPAFDREYEAALAASDADERNRRWAKCQEIVREDCPWVFTHYNRSYSLVRPRVGNYIPSAFPYGQEVNYVSGDRQ